MPRSRRRRRRTARAVARSIATTRDAGSAAYYSFHPTWDAPAPLAFAALGMRDVSPYILRVRALGLEAQVYDGDTFNPELALPGRFDFAFVLVFLAPLFVIALFHDLVSAEREAQRARMLDALSGGGGALVRRRTLVRLALVWAALGVPFAVAAAMQRVPAPAIPAVLALIPAYLLFWIALAARDDAAHALGWTPPPVGVQALLTRLAHTDAAGQSACQDRIRAFHARLRDFYYGFLFRDRPFEPADFARAPRFADPAG